MWFIVMVMVSVGVGLSWAGEEFLMETGVEYGSLIVPCKFPLNYPNASRQWISDGKIITMNDKIMNADYSLSTPSNSSERKPEYNLIIKKLSFAKHNGEFLCRRQYEEKGRLIFETRSVHVMVLVDPTQPRLGMYPTDPIKEFDEVTFSCSSFANPSPIIRFYWQRLSLNVPLNETRQEIIGHSRQQPSIVTYKWKALREFDDDNLTCEVRGRTFMTTVMNVRVKYMATTTTSAPILENSHVTKESTTVRMLRISTRGQEGKKNGVIGVEPNVFNVTSMRKNMDIIVLAIIITSLFVLFYFCWLIRCIMTGKIRINSKITDSNPYFLPYTEKDLAGFFESKAIDIDDKEMAVPSSPCRVQIHRNCGKNH